MAIRNGSCVGYYTIELIKENGILHLLDDNKDRTEEFKNNIKELIKKIEYDKLF